MKKETTVCFSGYRPEKMPFTPDTPGFSAFLEKQKEITDRLYEVGFRTFVTGGARGFDTWVAQDVLHLRRRHGDVCLHLALAFPGQEQEWNEEDRRLYRQIMEEADTVTYCSPRYERGVYYTRNRFMVDSSSFLVAAYDGAKGGTAYTVSYAMRQTVPVVCLRPKTLRVEYVGTARLASF
ncbi:MAG: DUF1273 domain-containing protein [Clostridia bacterium]|nr:DUF1273 domain-containing protein [Clostridia bacterium]